MNTAVKIFLWIVGLGFAGAVVWVGVILCEMSSFAGPSF